MHHVKSRALLATPLLLVFLAGCAPAGPAISADCDSAMKETAAVPFDQSNAMLLIATLDACDSLDDWSAALQKYPAVGAVPEITDQEVPLYLHIACTQAPDAGASKAICTEAVEKGLI